MVSIPFFISLPFSTLLFTIPSEPRKQFYRSCHLSFDRKKHMSEGRKKPTTSSYSREIAQSSSKKAQARDAVFVRMHVYGG